MNNHLLPLTVDLLIIVTDKKGTIVESTEPLNLLINGNIQQYIHPDDFKAFNRTLKSSADKNILTKLELRLKQNKVAYKWVEASISLYNNQFIKITFYPIDKWKKGIISITDSLKNEQYLNVMKSKFISTTSHEIRTPLSIIKSSAEVMMIFLDSIKEELLKERFKNYLININNESDRLSHLINEVLIMQKAESDMLECNKRTTDIVALIKNTIERHNLIQKDGRSIQLKVDGVIENVQIDPDLFEYIMDNLFSNAFKYSADSQNPVCTISYQEDELTIAVKDFGLGIPEKDINNIFQLYFRAENVKTIKGTGLGLNIVKKLLELHNGAILVMSVENKETTFVINLPKYQGTSIL